MSKTDPRKKTSRQALSGLRATRLHTGVPGLDDLLGGGLARGSQTLLLGPAGVGKTTFAMQWLLEGARQGLKTLYACGGASTLALSGLPFARDLQTLERRRRFHAFLPNKERDWEELLKALGQADNARACLEIARPLEQWTAQERDGVQRVYALMRQKFHTGLFTACFSPDASQGLESALSLIPSAEAILMLRYKDLHKGTERCLWVLKAPGGAPHPRPRDLEWTEKGLALSRPRGARKAPRPPKPRLKVSLPASLTPEQKQDYGQALRRLVGESFKDEAIEPAASELLYADILSELYAPSTDFGLMLVYDAIVPYLASQDLLLPLEDLFPDHHRRFLNQGLRRGLVDNRLYSIPKHVSVRLLYYRRDLLEKHGLKPPHTWDELEETALKVLQKEGNPNLRGLLFEASPETIFHYFLDLVWAQGQELYEKGPHWSLNHPAVAQALERLRRLLHGSRVAPETVLKTDFKTCIREFLDGRALFFHHWSDSMRLITRGGAAAQAAFGWVPSPSVSPKVDGYTLLGGASYVIPRRTRYPKAAGDLLRRLMNPEVQEQLEPEFGWPFPGLLSLYESPKVLAAHPYYARQAEFLRRGKLVEELPYIQGNYLNWESAGGMELSRFLSGQEPGLSIPQASERLEAALSPFLPSPLYSGLVSQAVEGVHRRLGDPQLSVESLADQLSVSQAYLIRRFKQETGSTPWQYLLGARIQRAKELLQFTTYNVSEVALQVGFKNVFHFSNAFQKITQRNPSDYKRSRFRQ